VADRSTNQTLLESVAREAARSLDDVTDMYEREYSALAKSARITNYVPLLALQRVRDQLKQSAHSRPH
jgi:hypothetical protein